MKENIIRVHSDELAVTFGLEGTGVSLNTIRDKKAKKNILTHKGELFTLKVRNIAERSEISLNSLSGWTKVSAIQEDSKSLILSLGGNKELDGVTVIITVTGGTDEINYEVNLINNNGKYALIECDYPILRFDATPNTSFFVPYGCGEIIPATPKSDWCSTQSYPSYGASMQYMAYLNTSGRGIYYGLHDPVPAAKRLNTTKRAADKTGSIKAFLPLANSESGYNSQKLSGRLVWKIFDGDWYDAAVFYRDFVETEAAFAPATGADGRLGVPDRFKNIDHWFMMQIKGYEPFADKIIEQAKELNVPCAVHLYHWHEIPFDNDYPHYFPVKEFVRGEVDKLQNAGILVMPYINGRLWDTKDRGMEDWQFTSVAKPYTTKKPDGTPYIETYSSKESDGSKVELAVMCPSTAVWQDVMGDTVSKLFDYGFDAVYIDQIAAAEAKPCADKGHSHLPGGGEWWCQSYNTLLERMTRVMNPECILTTECTADPFLRHIAGYLSWLWAKNNQVPAFPVIYSDKVILFGRCYYAIFDDEEQGFRILYTQSFLFGEQMGWIRPDTVETMPHREFYKNLVQIRKQIKRYFYAGIMLRPPVIKSAFKDLFTDKAREAYNKIIVYPAVNGTLWQDKKTQKMLLIIVNAVDESGAVEVSAEIPDGTYEMSGNYNGKVTVSGGKFIYQAKPFSSLIIEI